MSYVNDPEHAAWILRQQGELERRVAVLQGHLAVKDDGLETQEIDWFALELARQDVVALLNTMQPATLEDEDF